MVVEGKEQGLQIESAEVLFAVEQRHAWVVVLFPDRYWLLGVDDLLVLLDQDVLEGGL